MQRIYWFYIKGVREEDKNRYGGCAARVRYEEPDEKNPIAEYRTGLVGSRYKKSAYEMELLLVTTIVKIVNPQSTVYIYTESKSVAKALCDPKKKNCLLKDYFSFVEQKKLTVEAQHDKSDSPEFEIAERAAKEAAIQARDEDTAERQSWLKVYVDGYTKSYTDTNGGAWSYMVFDKKVKHPQLENAVFEGKGHVSESTTNNRMKILSVVEAMKALPQGSKAHILTRSKYLVAVLDSVETTFDKNMDYIEEFRKVIEEKGITHVIQYIDHNDSIYIQEVIKRAQEEYANIPMGGEDDILQYYLIGKETTSDTDMYVAYTDGSCNNLEQCRKGGWAYLAFRRYQEPSVEEVTLRGSGGMSGEEVSNNRMELLAMIELVRALPDNCWIRIVTDSQYCITVLDHKKKTFPKNMDYIKWFNEEVSNKHIQYEFCWVKGHNGNIYNEEVDRMAVAEFNKTSTIAGMNVSDFVSDNDFDRFKKTKQEESN